MYSIVLCLILDSRQNNGNGALPAMNIVLCLILDSRQNEGDSDGGRVSIVLCLILDSRQNLSRMHLFIAGLYCALFWIQGKTRPLATPEQNALYCALFWIQGKTAGL